MQASNSEERALVQRYNAISNARGLADLVLHWGAIIVLFWAVHATQSVWVGIAAFVLIAPLQNGLASLAHEAYHHKIFTNRPLNTFVGSFLYSYPLGLPYISYRKRHMEHHRRVGHSDDPDWGNYQGPQFESKGALYGFYAMRVLGAYLFANVLTVLRGRRPPVLQDHKKEDPTRDLLYLGITHIILFALIALAFSWWLYFVLWALPLVTLTSFLVGFRAYLEHNHPSAGAVVDERLFDYHPNVVEAFFVSPCNFHLHAIHHAYPAVPHYRLLQMKRELGEKGIAYPCEDRPSFLGTFFRKADALP